MDIKNKSEELHLKHFEPRLSTLEEDVKHIKGTLAEHTIHFGSIAQQFSNIQDNWKWILSNQQELDQSVKSTAKIFQRCIRYSNNGRLEQ